MGIDIYHIRQFWRKPWIIDIFLGLIILICILLIYRLSYGWGRFDYNAFLLNLITEVIGVWLSVRIIDRLMKKRERLQTKRKELLNNLRYPFDYITRKYPYYNNKDVTYLENEIKWFERRWTVRKDVFKLREQDIANAIHSLNIQLITEVSNVVIADKLQYNDSQDKKKLIDERLESLDNKLILLEAKIEELVLAFWQTDNPDKI